MHSKFFWTICLIPIRPFDYIVRHPEEERHAIPT
jgi:hypothetical protein